MNASREQQLINIMFEMVYRITQERRDWNPSRTESMHWVANTLMECGFKTRPMGASWGILTEDLQRQEFNETWGKMLKE